MPGTNTANLASALNAASNIYGGNHYRRTMAASTCLKYPLCVEWTTELPYECTPRKSPNIYFRDFECYLRLKFDCEFQEYKLSLGNKTDTVLKNIFKVTTYIQDDFLSRPVLIEEKSICSEDDILWCKTRKDVLGLISNIFDIGKFTIICTFHFKETKFENRRTGIVSSSCNALSNDLRSLSVHFSRLLEEETFVDVKLKCGDRTFSAHKSVLGARSCVFASKFNKMAAKDVDSVEIEDVDPHVLNLLIKYVYSGENPELREEDTARNLYEAAIKYEVLSLREACSDWLVRNMTPDSCLELLEFAAEYEDEVFVEEVACFVAKHLCLLSRESWSALKEDSPSVAIKVYEKLCGNTCFQP